MSGAVFPHADGRSSIPSMTVETQNEGRSGSEKGSPRLTPVVIEVRGVEKSFRSRLTGSTP